VEIISAPVVAHIKYPDPSLVQQVSDKIVLKSDTMRALRFNMHSKPDRSQLLLLIYDIKKLK